MSSTIVNTGKLPTAVLFAAVMTFTLFWLMQQLVSGTDELPPQVKRPKIATIVIPDTEPEVSRIEPLPVREEEIEIIDPPPSVTSGHDLTAPGFSVGSGPEIEEFTNEFSAPLAEGSAMVLRQVNPIYPTSALNKGIEGFVLVEFDINPIGMVVNPRVVYAEPENTFNRSALAAIERWRFKPKMEDGKEVSQYSERRRLVFSIKE